jgi:hypothetical protein
VCTARIPGGHTLTGTGGNDIITITITITGGPVNGSVLAVAGNDTITVTGTAGAVGLADAAGGPGITTHPAGFAGSAGTAGGVGGIGTR